MWDAVTGGRSTTRALAPAPDTAQRWSVAMKIGFFAIRLAHIGGQTDAALRRAARLGDGWFDTPFRDAAETTAGIEEIGRTWCKAAARFR